MSEHEQIIVQDLVKTFTVRNGLAKMFTINAVKGVSFSIKPGETVALIGESGSGKTTVGRMILGLLGPSSGEVKYKGQSVQSFRRDKLRSYHKAVQAVFQDPYSSLNSKMRVGEIITEPLRNFGYKGDCGLRLAELLQVVGLSSDFAARYPYQCSGGQKQRVAIARALAAEPEFIVLDEPLSSLDITVQTQIIALLNSLKSKHRIGYLLITHDLRVVKAMADQVVVMFRGDVVETAGKAEFFACPQHFHSRALMAAVPSIDGLQQMKVTV